jgi:hypothetical protein
VELAELLPLIEMPEPLGKFVIVLLWIVALVRLEVVEAVP